MQYHLAARTSAPSPLDTMIEVVPAIGDDTSFDEGFGFLDTAYVSVSMAAREDGTEVYRMKPAINLKLLKGYLVGFSPIFMATYSY